jgi:iron complex transport system ATP-binding protein
MNPPPLPSRLRARDLALGYAGRDVVTGLDLDLPTGRVTAIVGPNACGKSTLLRGLARLLRPTHGAVLLDGAAITERPTREVATVLGILPQQPIAPEGLTVLDLVSRGRHPHLRLLRRWTAADEDAVVEALVATDTLHLSDRLVDTLSGGQRQRVWLALSLAQRSEILLLDEPTTFLDLAHQVDMLDLVDSLNATRGTTVVMALHDLGLACRYADHLVAMRDGAILAQGPPSDVITAETVHSVFGLDAHVLPDPVTGTPIVVPAGGRRATITTAHTSGALV